MTQLIQTSLFSPEVIELERITRLNPTSPLLHMSTSERHHRALQEYLFRELRELQWELFYSRAEKYSCHCFLENGPTTENYFRWSDAVEEANKYSIIYELYPDETLRLVFPEPPIPNEYRRLLIQHEVYNRRLPPVRP